MWAVSDRIYLDELLVREKKAERSISDVLGQFVQAARAAAIAGVPEDVIDRIFVDWVIRPGASRRRDDTEIPPRTVRKPRRNKGAQPAIGREVVDVNEACAIVGCSRSHFYDSILRQGLVTPISHGRKRIFYLRSEVEALAKRGYY